MLEVLKERGLLVENVNVGHNMDLAGRVAVLAGLNGERTLPRSNLQHYTTQMQ